MTRFASRFARLGLRWNPFGEVPSDERGALAVVDTGPWIAHLLRPPGSGRTATPPGAVQFIGDSGRGKTTRLLALRDALVLSADAAHPIGAVRPAYVRVLEHPRTAPRWPDDATVVLIDEVQHATASQRARVVSSGLPLAFGTHVDFTKELQVAGYDVLTVEVDGLAAEGLAALCARRIAWARRRDEATPTVTARACRALLTEHGSDVRAIEGELYEVFQRLQTPDAVDERAIYAVRRDRAATIRPAALPSP